MQRLLLLLLVFWPCLATRQTWPPNQEAVTNICRGPPFVQVRLLLDIEFVAQPKVANATALAISSFLTAANGIRPLSERALQLLIASGRNTWVLPFERLVSTTSIINFLRLWSQMLHLHGSWASRSVETALNFARQWPNKGVPRVLIIFAAGHNTAQLWAKMHLVRGVVDRVLVIKAGASSSSIRIELSPTKYQSSMLGDMYENLARIICTLESCPAPPPTVTPTITTKISEITTLTPFTTVSTGSSTVSTSATVAVSTNESTNYTTAFTSVATQQTTAAATNQTSSFITTPSSNETPQPTGSTTETTAGNTNASSNGTTAYTNAATTTEATPQVTASTSESSQNLSTGSTVQTTQAYSNTSTNGTTAYTNAATTTETTPQASALTSGTSQNLTTGSTLETTTASTNETTPYTTTSSTYSPNISSASSIQTTPYSNASTNGTIASTAAPTNGTTQYSTFTQTTSENVTVTHQTTFESSNESSQALTTTMSPSVSVSMTPKPAQVCSLYKRLFLLLQKQIKKAWSAKVAAEVKNQHLVKELGTCTEIRVNLTQLINTTATHFLKRYQQLKERAQKLEAALAVCKAQAKMLVDQHKDTLGRLQKVQAQLSEVESNLKEQQQAAVKLRVDLEKARAQAQLLNERLRAVDAKRQKVEAELALERERSKAAQKDHEAALERLRKELVELERERDNLLKALAEAKEAREKIASKASQLLREMQARASILVFSMRSGSGLSFANAFYSEKDYSPENSRQDGRLFKSEKLKLWTIGRYRRVSLILRNRGRPVVRLDFDGKRAGRYNWFSPSNLLNSFPWPANTLTRDGSMRMGSAKTATHMAVMSPKATCNQPRGFLAVIDSPTTCYWTWTPRLGRFPHFLYSFDPTGKVGLLSNAQERREADTLEIRVIPYVTFYRATGMMGHFARWDFEHQYLVFSVTAGSSLDPAAMWKGNLISPPQFFTNEHLLNSEWFRSAALNTWPTARYRRAVVSLVDAVGDVKASFEFDLVGAQRNNWFTLQRLRSASPWTAREIRASNPKNFRIGQPGDAVQFVIGGDKAGRIDCKSPGFLAVVTNTKDLPCVRGARPVLVANLRSSSLQEALLRAPKHQHQLRISML